MLHASYARHVTGARGRDPVALRHDGARTLVDDLVRDDSAYTHNSRTHKARNDCLRVDVEEA
eukprot:33156-Eustigmatos_ZCMA.PRE.1